MAGYSLPVTPVDPGTTGLIASFRSMATPMMLLAATMAQSLVRQPTRRVRLGQAIQLNGVDQMVDVNAVGISGAAPRTIAGWARGCLGGRLAELD